MKWTIVCSHSYLFLGVVGDGHKRPPVASLQPLWAAAPTLLVVGSCRHPAANTRKSCMPNIAKLALSRLVITVC